MKWNMIKTFIELIPCYVNPCYHGIGHPGTADGRDGIQMWMVAVNVLN
jgi:hypothetical protein